MNSADCSVKWRLRAGGGRAEGWNERLARLTRGPLENIRKLSPS